MSYRRRSYRGNAGTRFIRQKYQYFVDMQTKDTTMQVIKITAGGRMPQIRLRPFFAAFKYFKLNTVKVRFVPCATLPVDPTGLSYEAGEQTIDPRDQMNPGLVRITNGEDVSELTTILTGVDAERAYYTTMLDPRWYKFQLQRGFKRTAYPLLWNVGQPHQSMSQVMIAQTIGSAIQDSNDPEKVFGGYGEADVRSQSPVAEFSGPSVTEMSADDYSQNLLDSVLMQTGRVKMGWMPTDMFDSGLKGPSPVPEVDLITVVLPKAYKTVYYYRLYIEEEILFKDPVAMLPVYRVGGSVGVSGYVNTGAIDRYLFAKANGVTAGNNYYQVVPELNAVTNKVNGGKES